MAYFLVTVVNDTEDNCTCSNEKEQQNDCEVHANSCSLNVKVPFAIHAVLLSRAIFIKAKFGIDG